MNKLTISQLPTEMLQGKRVFVRMDVDAQYAPTPALIDGTKLHATLPTLEYLISVSARIIIGTHLGDPRGEVVESLRLDGVGQRLAQLLGKPVRKLNEAIGADALVASAELRDSEVLLLENLCFYAGEDQNDPAFARQLAQLCDVYCNDSFALTHRGMASTVGIARYVRPAVAGLDLARELLMIEEVLANPKLPVVAIVGGTRLEEKLPIIENLLPQLDRLFIGGTLAFKFLKAKGQRIGAAFTREAFAPLVKDFLRDTPRKIELILPQDFLVVNVDEFRAYEQGGRKGPVPTARRVLDSEIRSSDLPVDIGPWTVSRIKGLIDGANTILWNGPLGIWEIPLFAEGTRTVAKLFTERVSPNYQRSIVCGDSLSRAIHSFDLPIEHFPHLTPGGEPALRLLGGNQLPAVSALDNEVDLVTPVNTSPRRILLPVDGSDHSLEAVGKLGSLINTDYSQISLLHVASSESRLEQLFTADRIFSAADAALAQQGLISHQQITLEGNPADEILKFADEVGADLIAMGSHGLSGVLRLLMGSVSQKVLNQAKCPVLIVRIPDEEMVKAGLLQS